MQFSNLSSQLAAVMASETGDAMILPRALFIRLLVAALRQKGDFDETFYVARYPDIRQAVHDGVLREPAEHYYGTGYFENRQPKNYTIDEKFYLRENPDVSEAMRQGAVTSPQEHFDTVGFREGRRPYAGFSLY